MIPQQKPEQELPIGLTAPAPVTLAKLREHFRETYKLTETQVELMVTSSSKSLEQGLAQLTEVRSEADSITRLCGIYHGLKGVLLNMGEPEWAAYTKEIERQVMTGEKLDHGRIAIVLQRGVFEVLAYCGATDAGLMKSCE